MTTDLRDLLEMASDDVPEVDLAPTAWAEARRHHRTVVRRTVVGAGVVAVAGVVLAAVVDEPDPDEPGLNRADALPTLDVEAGRLPSVEVDGIPVFLAPDPVAEARLPRYPRSAALAVPRHVGPGDPETRAVMGVDGLRGVPEPVRAVFLVTGEGGRLSPVIYAPRAPSPHVLVPTVRVLERPGTPVLGPRAISDDRHRVVIPQPARLLVLDARDGSVADIPVPDPTLSVAGWARDGVTVVARGRDDGWLVEADTGAVRRADRPVEADWFDIADAEGAARLQSFSGAGELTGSRPLRGPWIVPNGPTVSNTEGWVAGGTFLPGAYQDQVLRSQGLVAVQSDLRPTPRLLAATTSVLVPKGAYRALAWGPQDTLLFESRSERPGLPGTVRRVLAWDVIGARLWQVADVDRAGRGVGDFSGSYTL